jgi:hypothetical protein
MADATSAPNLSAGAEASIAPELSRSWHTKIGWLLRKRMLSDAPLRLIRSSETVPRMEVSLNS